MLRYLDQKNMGVSDLGWLKSKFHFSFAEYYNPKNVNFGALRVINDDLVKAGTGFDTHPHRDMEIISYVVKGPLSHQDSMGNTGSVDREDVQYMSAGTGVLHSEYNHSQEIIRFLQIWILPDKKGHAPNYGDYHFPWKDRVNQWLKMVSSQAGDAPIKINQDATISVLALDPGKVQSYEIGQGRQGYLVQIEGRSRINGIDMQAQDALEIMEETIEIEGKKESHFLLIDLKKA